MLRLLTPSLQRVSIVVGVAVAGFSVGFVACSGEGHDAPHVIAPDDDVGDCPGADSVLTSLQTELDRGTFDPLRPTIERVLVDEGGLKTQLLLLSVVLPELTGDEIKTVLSVLSSDDGKATVDAFLPHVVNILEYLHGTGSFIPGKHPEPVAAAHDILTSCDAAEQVGTVRDLLALEVKRSPPGSAASFVVADPGTGDSSYVFALLTAVDKTAKLPQLKGLLEKIQIEEDGDVGGGGDVVIGRQAFVVLAKLLAANIAAPDFQLQPTRDILEDVLVPQLDGDAEAEAALDELLDLLGILVDSDSATFEGVQAFMGCVDRHDHEAAIPGMLFDYLTIDELPVEDLLDDVVGAAQGEQNGALRVALVQLLDAALLHPDNVSDATRVVAEFLDPAVADDVLGAVLSLKGKGVLADLTSFLDTLLTCKQVQL